MNYREAIDEQKIKEGKQDWFWFRVWVLIVLLVVLGVGVLVGKLF